MNDKFEDFDFVVLNEVNTNGRFSSEDMEVVDSEPAYTQPSGMIKIFDLDDRDADIEFTYEKLFEILESRNDGLKPEMWY